LLVPAVARAQVPLHQRIDRLIAAGVPASQLAGPATDTEFVRRIFLDLTGSIPTAAEVRAFLKEPSPGKRQQLIDRLLASSEHARYLAAVLDVWLMERRPAKAVSHPLWLDYLRESVAANKPWDQLVREVLAADGADPKQRHLARFYLDRDGEPNLLTKDVSRLLLGMNLQCCQCHDHPRVEEYKQEHYYGLFAFLSRGQLVRDLASKQMMLGEKADGEVTFQSVFDPAKTTKATGPRLPYGPVLKEPPVEKGKEYLVAPAPGKRAVPRYSRRALLGPELTRPAHVAFRRNVANRLWALLMGRGLVQPLDMDHPANPPSHPELLALLTDEMLAHKFDLRYLLRELALSQTYQRTSELPAGAAGLAAPDRYSVALLKPLSPEQMAWGLMQATGVTDAARLNLGGPKATEAALYGQLSRNVAPFLTTFANPPGTPPSFDATIDQALFLANGSLVRSWLAPARGNLTDRLLAASTAGALAEELYLSVFSRLPTAEELKETTDFLAGRQADRAKAVQELAWALLASAEFRFNH